jgi:hypothetical protein
MRWPRGYGQGRLLLLLVAWGLSSAWMGLNAAS